MSQARKNSNSLQPLSSDKVPNSAFSLIDDYMGDNDTPAYGSQSQRKPSNNHLSHLNYADIDGSPSPNNIFLSEEAGELDKEDDSFGNVSSPMSQTSSAMDRHEQVGNGQNYFHSTNKNTVRQSMPPHFMSSGSRLSYSPWVEYLTKTRDDKEKSVDNLKSAFGSRQTLNEVDTSAPPKSPVPPYVEPPESEEITYVEDDAASGLKSSISENKIDKRRNVVSLGNDFDKWKHAIEMELEGLDKIMDPKGTVSGTPSLGPRVDSTKANAEDGVRNKRAETANTVSTVRDSSKVVEKDVSNVQAPGWNIKVWEYSQPAMGTEYKTLFVHPDSTSYELLAMILKKWRYLSPSVKAEFSGPRIKLSDSLKMFIERDGWELLHVKRNAAGEETADVISEGIKISDLFTSDRAYLLAFRRRLNVKEEIITDYQKSSMLDPCYILKLNSQYTLPANPPGPNESPLNIGLNQWARRFIILAKNRYLLFFKTDNHARWVHNVLHEVDCSRIVKVDKYSANVVDTELTRTNSLREMTVNSNDFSEEDPVLSHYVVQIRTRTRTILLAVETLEDQERLIIQLNEIKNHLSKPKLSKELPSKDSTKSFDSGLSPLQKLIAKVENTKRINDVDLPPFEYDPRTTEWITWSVQSNLSLAATLKELAIKKLMTIAEQNRFHNLIDLNEFLSIINVNNGLETGKEKESSMVNTVKKLFKGWQPGTTSGPTEGKTSTLFGVSLEDLTARYDMTNLGLPVLPPVVRLGINFLMEKGLHAGGIFRIAGSVKRMDLLKKAFEKLDFQHLNPNAPDTTHVTTITSIASNSSTNVFSGNGTPTSSTSQLIPEQSIDFSPYNVHDVAGILKMFLRDLPEPLLTSRLYKIWLLSERVKNSDMELQYLRCLIILLPPVHRHLLEALLAFLHAIAENSEDKPLPPGAVIPDANIENDVIKGNLMNSSNLAVVMGPNILRESRSNDDKKDLLKTNSPANLRNPSHANMDGSPHTTSELNLASQELTDSNAVVHVVQKLIEKYSDLFKINDDMMEELKKLTTTPVTRPLPQFSASTMRRVSKFA